MTGGAAAATYKAEADLGVDLLSEVVARVSVAG
jgi:hypothetical protein